MSNSDSVFVKYKPLLGMMSILFKFRFLFFAVYLLALFYGLFSSNLPTGMITSSDKLMHLVAFIGLGLISRFTFIRSAGLLVWSVLFVSAPILEYLQPILAPQRVFSFLDIVANLAGITLALIIWLCVGRYFMRLVKNVGVKYSR